MKDKLYSHTIFENSPYGLVITDLNGKIIDSNPVFAGLIGRPVEELRSLNYLQLLSEKSITTFEEQHSSVCTSGTTGPVHSCYHNANGDKLEVLVSATRLEDDGQQLICWFIEDLDAQSQSEQPIIFNSPVINRELQISAAQAKSILATAVDGIVTINQEGLILSFNPAAEDMFGYSSHEVIGKNISILMPAHYGQNHNSYISNYLNTGEKKIIGIGREAKAKRKDGSKFDVHLSVSETTVDETVLFTGIIRDISDKKKAESALRESEQKFRLAFEAAAIGMALVSPDSRWLKINDALCDITEFSRKELISTQFFNLVHPDDVEGVKHELETILKSQDTSYLHTDCRFISKNGNIKWLSCSISLVRELNNAPLYFVFQLNDITRRVYMEKKLFEAREKSDNANQAKSQFLYNLSHELRTPLSAILGFSDVLESSETLDEEQISDVRHIKKASHIILQLVKDVLDLAKIEAGQVELNIGNVELCDLVQQSCDLVRHTADEKKICILIEDSGIQAQDLIVDADALRAKQVILNLLTNAIKYNREHGKITINYHIYESDRVRLSITDTGHGIPEGKVEQLFQPFNRLGAEHSEVEGTGIGLVIIKTLMEQMGGKIGVYSTEGKGSTFWIEFCKARNNERLSETEQMSYVSHH